MKADRFIALDIGTEYIRMGIFAQFGTKPAELIDQGSVALDPSSDMPRDAVVATALKRLLDEKKPSARKVRIAIDGSAVFSRTVKLPPVAADKVEQTIRHEAVQNIPFPIDDVVWDSHVIDATELEPDVLLVAVKSELVDGLVHAVRANGLQVDLVTAAPVALANTVRFSFPEVSEPILLVDIGTTSTNFVFVDGLRTFFRSLPVSGGMTPRLMQEIERSIAFYQSQQGGSAPERILLTGNAVDPAEFQNRLGLPTERFDLKQAGEGLAVLTGMAVRGLSALLINLLPAAVEKERQLQRQLPWWFACAAVLLLVVGVWIWSLNQGSVLAQQENWALAAQIQTLEMVEVRQVPLEQQIQKLERQLVVYRTAIAEKIVWLEVLENIRARLPEGMFLLASESLSDDAGLKGLRVTVVSYLDKEPAGQDAVKALRDNLRKSDRFSAETKVFSRPSKRLFARQFVLDVYFAVRVAK